MNHIVGMYRLARMSRHLVLAILLSACSYKGYVEEPVTIKFTWYSYLAGDDIRQTCVPNGLPRYRMVYNGRYDEQVRSYEMIGLDDGGARLVSRVLGPMRAFALIKNPFDLQDPWRWTVSEARLSPQEFDSFKAALDEGGMRRPLVETMELLSVEFYWIVSGCDRGSFLFNAWRFGTNGYGSLTFPSFLLAHDGTGIALNPPRPVTPAERIRSSRPAGRRSFDDQLFDFRVKVGPNGLEGMGPYL